MMGANIQYPYDSVPNTTLPDGTPGIWTMIGAAEVVQEEMVDKSGDTDKNQINLDCGPKRKDEK